MGINLTDGIGLGVQGLADTSTSTKKETSSTGETSTAAISNDFASILRSAMGSESATSVNEEELFAGLITDRLSKHVNTDAADAYSKLLSERKSANTRADGYVFVEKSANEALDELQSEGIITDEQYQQVKDEAFKAAQIDDNLNALFDGRGSSTDKTIAVKDFDAAMLAAQAMLTKIDNGEDTTPTNSASEATSTSTTDSTDNKTITPEGTAVDGTGSGFLYKPISESNGNLVVLLPAHLSDQVMDLVLKDENGTEIEHGNSTGYANADSFGEREHFRFTKPGDEYPKNLQIEVALKDGSMVTYQIPDPSLRYD